MHCVVFRSICGFYSLDASSSLPSVTTKNVSRPCQMSPGGQNQSQLKNHCTKIINLICCTKTFFPLLEICSDKGHAFQIINKFQFSLILQTVCGFVIYKILLHAILGQWKKERCQHLLFTICLLLKDLLQVRPSSQVSA